MTAEALFTGKGRDVETGLDYFGARYFSGAQGRFASSDPLLNSGRPQEAQSSDRFAYVVNNPLQYSDPSGLYEWGGCNNATDEKCKAAQNAFQGALAKLERTAAQMKVCSTERKRLKERLRREAAKLTAKDASSRFAQ